jgi:hypothetical protein
MNLIEGSTLALTRAGALEAAKEMGLEVVTPKPNQLQLDIDCLEAMNHYSIMRSVLDQRYCVLKESITTSKSGGDRKHITLTLDRDITPTERILLQATLGSDRKRELLSYFRVLDGEELPTLFFEVPEIPRGSIGSLMGFVVDEEREAA